MHYLRAIILHERKDEDEAIVSLRRAFISIPAIYLQIFCWATCLYNEGKGKQEKISATCPHSLKIVLMKISCPNLMA